MMRFVIGFLIGYNARAIGRLLRLGIALASLAWLISRVGSIGRLAGPVGLVAIAIMWLTDPTRGWRTKRK